MAHVRKVGGVFKEKQNRTMIQVPMKCKFHYAVRVFLEELYKDYNGSEFGSHLAFAFTTCLLMHYPHAIYTKFHSAIGHEAIYFMGDEKYKKARSAADHWKEREKQYLQSENDRLAEKVSAEEQKVADLQKINKSLYDKSERLRSEMEKLGIVKEEKREVTETELEEWCALLIQGWRDDLKHLVTNGRLMYMLTPHASQTSKKNLILTRNILIPSTVFSLQVFLDSIYNKDESIVKKNKTAYSDEAVFSAQELKVCREVLFGDIVALDELNGKKPMNISNYLVSKWKITYKKLES
jgi:hypothetical protein